MAGGGMAGGGMAGGGMAGGGLAGGGMAGGNPPPGFFVATTGRDDNPGTLAAPFATIQKAVNTVGAGTGSIFVRGGTYPNKVKIAGSNTVMEGALILQAYNGESVIIDGAALTVSGQEGLITIDTRDQVTVRGFEIRKFMGPKSTVPVGIFATGSGVGLTIIGNHIHDIVQQTESCKGGGDAFGLAVYGTDNANPWTQVIIDGNEVDQLKTGCSESLTVNGNIDGFVISNNKVHDNDNIGIDAIGFEGTAQGANDQVRNGTISGNSVYNITSLNNPAYENSQSADGIYVDGGKNIVIERNTIRNVDIALEVASEMPGKAASYVLVRNNVLQGSPQAGLSIGGYDSLRGATDHCLMINNTLSQNTTELQIQFYATSNIYQNNLVYNSGGTYRSGSATGVNFINNLEKTGNIASVFVSAPLNLRPAAAALAIGTGTPLAACPAGWTCPSLWTLPLHGALDVAATARVIGGLDVGAYEQ
jgi:Right handed beta helix region